MKQYIIEFSRHTVKKSIISILIENNIAHPELKDKKVTEKSFFRTTDNWIDQQEHWEPKDWISFLINKGFWIDSFTYSRSVSAQGTYIDAFAIIHLKQ